MHLALCFTFMSELSLWHLRSCLHTSTDDQTQSERKRRRHNASRNVVFCLELLQFVGFVGIQKHPLLFAHYIGFYVLLYEYVFMWVPLVSSYCKCFLSVCCCTLNLKRFLKWCLKLVWSLWIFYFSESCSSVKHHVRLQRSHLTQ